MGIGSKLAWVKTFSHEILLYTKWTWSILWGICPSRSRYCFNKFGCFFICLGLTETPPAQCVHNLRIETQRQDLYIMPGVVNCISCNILGDIFWLIEVDNDLVLTTSSIAAEFASTMNNYLIIAMPEDYVEPGTSGRRDILCSAVAGSPSLEARLASPGKVNIKGGD